MPVRRSWAERELRGISRPHMRLAAPSSFARGLFTAAEAAFRQGHEQSTNGCRRWPAEMITLRPGCSHHRGRLQEESSPKSFTRRIRKTEGSGAVGQRDWVWDVGAPGAGPACAPGPFERRHPSPTSAGAGLADLVPASGAAGVGSTALGSTFTAPRGCTADGFTLASHEQPPHMRCRADGAVLE